MASNAEKTLIVSFIPDVDDVYPLLLYMIDSRNYRICLHVRGDNIIPLIICLSHPMSSPIRLITMTGDYDVKWWSNHEVAFVNHAARQATVLSWQEAKKLVVFIKREIFRSASTTESDPLAGANRRRDENLNSVFG